MCLSKLISSIFIEFQEESLRNEHLLLERVANLEKLVIKLTRLAASNCSDNTNINWPAKTLEELEQIEAILKTEKTIYNKEVCMCMQRKRISLWLCNANE